MSNLEDAIYAELVGVVGDRVYRAGQITASPRYPYVTFERTSSTHERHLGGGSEIANASYEFNIWTLDALEAEDLAELVRKRLDNRRGEMGTSENPIEVRVSFLETVSSEPVPPADNSSQAIFRVSMDFNIWYRESLTPVP